MTTKLTSVSALILSKLIKQNIGFSAFACLIVLREEGPKTLTDLAKAVGLNPSSMTALKDTLIKRGLVSYVHSEEDRRKCYLCCNATGRIFTDEVVEKFNQ